MMEKFEATFRRRVMTLSQEGRNSTEKGRDPRGKEQRGAEGQTEVRPNKG